MKIIFASRNPQHIHTISNKHFENNSIDTRYSNCLNVSLKQAPPTLISASCLKDEFIKPPPSLTQRSGGSLFTCLQYRSKVRKACTYIFLAQEETTESGDRSRTSEITRRFSKYSRRTYQHQIWRVTQLLTLLIY